MEASVELKELYVQCCNAISKGDDGFFKRHFSIKDGVLAIGTDPAEWWVGYKAITGVFEAQLRELGGVEVLADAPEAYQDGPVGWVGGQPFLRMPDGTEMRFRLTVVFQKDEGHWKIVQWHFSSGVSNADLIGEALTTQ